MTLAEQMAEAAELSLHEPVCMFCGCKFDEDDLIPHEDWDGNTGRACPTCRDNQD